MAENTCDRAPMLPGMRLRIARPLTDEQLEALTAAYSRAPFERGRGTIPSGSRAIFGEVWASVMFARYAISLAIHYRRL